MTRERGYFLALIFILLVTSAGCTCSRNEHELSADELTNKICLLVKEGDLQEAQDLAFEAIERFPEKPYFRYHLAIVTAQLVRESHYVEIDCTIQLSEDTSIDDFGEALSFADLAITASSQEPDTHWRVIYNSYKLKGDIYQELSIKDMALAAYKDALDVPLGKACLPSEQADKASLAYAIAAMIIENVEPPRKRVFDTIYYEPFPEEANRFLERAIVEAKVVIDLDPRDKDALAEALFTKASALDMLLRYEEAIGLYEALLDMEVTDKGLVNSCLTISYAGAKKYDELVTLTEKLVSSDSGNAGYLFYRGVGKAGLGDYSQAVLDYSTAIELVDDAGIYEARGIARIELEEYKEAIADFEKAIELEIDEVYINRVRKRIEQVNQR